MPLVVFPDDPVRRSRHITCGISATLTTLGFILIASTGAGWKAATALAIANLAVLASHNLRHHDPMWNRMWAVALVAAPFALIGDWWCVKQAGLAYTQQGPFLLVSPLYLPLLYPAAVFQIWYTVDMVRVRSDGPALNDQTPYKPSTFAMAITASVLFGCLYVPLYECLAKYGELWIYADQPGLFNGVVPWYVIAAEAFQFAVTPLVFTGLRTRSATETFLTGIFVGLATVGCWSVCIFLFSA